LGKKFFCISLVFFEAIFDVVGMRTADFDYTLPPELIAQEPAARRDQSRLMVLDRATGAMAHRGFANLEEYLNPGDLLVLNDSRVIPARLRGRNAETGGHFEVFLVSEVQANLWWTLMKPGRRARPGTLIQILDSRKSPTPITAVVMEVNAEGHRLLRFEGADNIRGKLEVLGEVPLPPYIERAATRPEDCERYQTVYARDPGSVAAPTAGLHFTTELLERIRGRGVDIRMVTLHVGLGTFMPVKEDNIDEHRMHEERFSVSQETADAINAVKQDKGSGRRVIGVGTTTMRVLESVARANGGRIIPGPGTTDIFIYPPSPFYIIDTMVTNFHLPCSTLLMLVSAFAAPGEMRGREMMLRAYREAVEQRYRFFSYGDAMLIR
jgi:S-adenosylmethionine:tRNA ribosyltransferase-isomerase